MGIVGKLVGGTVGFVLGGPLGAIAGTVFGHAYDQGNETLEQDSNRALNSLETSQLTFFVCTFSMLAKLVKADGEISHKEIDTIQSFALKDLNLSMENREVAEKIFQTAIQSPARFEDFAIQFNEQFRSQPQMSEMMIDILVRVAVSDGKLSLAEETLIYSAATIFNIQPDRLALIKSRYSNTLDNAYIILGANPQDSNEKIKKRYRELAQAYHPDKISSKGLPNEFVQLAHEKFREIQSAYEEIKEERGMK